MSAGRCSLVAPVARPARPWVALGASRGNVQITSERLEEFVRAEMSVFARRTDRPLQPLKLQDLLRISSSPSKVAELVHEELPVRFARRINHLERIVGWEEIPELVELHDMHAKSFRELRLADPANSEVYPGTILRIRQRHKRIPELFAEALRRIDIARVVAPVVPAWSPGSAASLSGEHEGYLGRTSVEQWADIFLSSRVSTEIQMSHYIACVGASSNATDGAVDRTKVGIIDTRCAPLDICKQAADHIRESQFPCTIEVESTCGDVTFCHAPMYLYYIMVELLRNSARATFERWPDAEKRSARPIKIAICADDQQVAIRVSDQGGGFVSRGDEDVWSYTFTTAVERAPDPGQVGRFSSVMDTDSAQQILGGRVLRPWGVFGGQSPISGRGIGLPLSRLYAMYFGGSLRVINMPGLGVDSFLFLKRIET